MSEATLEETVSSPVLANALVQSIRMSLLGDETENGWYNGLVFALRGISAERASQRPREGSSVLQHAEHTRFCLEMVNAWLAGENPEADWGAAWKLQSLAEPEWQALIADLNAQFERLLETVQTRPAWRERGLVMVLNNLAHTAYHAGAIRQLLKL